VDRLIDLGLVERFPDDEDRRIREAIVITSKHQRNNHKNVGYIKNI